MPHLTMLVRRLLASKCCSLLYFKWIRFCILRPVFKSSPSEAESITQDIVAVLAPEIENTSITRQFS